MLLNRRKTDSRAITGISAAPNQPDANASSSSLEMRSHLLSQDAILECQASGQFEEILAAHIEQFRPADPIELELVREMSLTTLRIRRARAFETRIIEDNMGHLRAADTANPPDARHFIARGLVGALDMPLFNRLSRYQERLSRKFTQAFQRLVELKRAARLPAPNTGQSASTRQSAPKCADKKGTSGQRSSGNRRPRTLRGM